MSEIDYDALDPGIRDVVRYLRGCGYDTTDSGDGVTKFAQGARYGDECVIPYPHVVVTAGSSDNMPQQAQALRDILALEFGSGWEVQASWSTEDRRTVLFASKEDR